MALLFSTSRLIVIGRLTLPAASQVRGGSWHFLSSQRRLVPGGTNPSVPARLRYRRRAGVLGLLASKIPPIYRLSIPATNLEAGQAEQH